MGRPVGPLPFWPIQKGGRGKEPDGPSAGGEWRAWHDSPVICFLFFSLNFILITPHLVFLFLVFLVALT
jgi:hypothetical protein